MGGPVDEAAFGCEADKGNARRRSYKEDPLMKRRLAAKQTKATLLNEFISAEEKSSALFYCV